MEDEPKMEIPESPEMRMPKPACQHPQRAVKRPFVGRMRMLRASLPLMTALLLGMALAGCTTKSKSRAQAQQAFLAGQQRAAQAIQHERTVTVLGHVRNRFVPWQEGLTLAEAINAAVYTSLIDPRIIRLTRGSERVEIRPSELLSGAFNPELKPGDLIELR